MYPQRPVQQAAARRRKPPNKALLMVLVSVLGVLALCVVGVVVYGVTSGDKTDADSSATTAAAVANGIPPTPGPDAWKAYISALRDIDPDIVAGKEESLIVNRGRDQCGSVKQTPNDQPKLVELTNKRFTSPNHPEGFGAEKSTRILAAVRQYICPTY
ncbi:hypothetical protein ACQEVZ_20300 [Dactylosporangium sp. CA-152071]|uniref:hypothetical protein n=1 Tax=Dactylosporangium sp. CA-152071 TaxID=3239933 RepID=UPI003D8DD0ED